MRIKTETELAAYIERRARLLERVATFHVLNRIVKKWGDYESFLTTYNSFSKGGFWRKNSKWFHLDTLSKIVGVPRVSGKQKRILNDVLARIDPTIIQYRANTSIHYKSGKSYNIHSGFFIPLERLRTLLADGRALFLDGGIYSDEEIYVIKKFVLGYKDAKRRKLSARRKRIFNEGIEDLLDATVRLGDNPHAKVDADADDEQLYATKMQTRFHHSQPQSDREERLTALDKDMDEMPF